MTAAHPFFLQFHVDRRVMKRTAEAPPQGLATVIVFAECEEIARARAGRKIAGNGLGIRKLIRIHLIREKNLSMFDTILRSVYSQAERFGIGFHCDFWADTIRCCDPGEPAGDSRIH